MPPKSRTTSADVVYHPNDYVLAERDYTHVKWPAQVIDAKDAPLAVRKMRPSKGRTRYLCVRLLAAEDEHEWCLPEALTKLTKEDVEAFIDDDMRTADPVYAAYKAVFDALNWVAPALPDAEVQSVTQDAETQESQRDELQSVQDTQPPLPINLTSPLPLRSSPAPPPPEAHPDGRLVEEAPVPATHDEPIDHDANDDQSRFLALPSTVVSLNGSPERAGLAGAVGEGETGDAWPSGLRHTHRSSSDAMDDHEDEVQFIGVSLGFRAAASAEMVVKVEDNENAYTIPPGDDLSPSLPLGELDHDMQAEESDVVTPSDLRDVEPTAVRASAKVGEIESERNDDASDRPADLVCEWKLILEKIFDGNAINDELLPEADDIFSLLEDSQLSSKVVLMSSIHVLLKRLWVDGDHLLGDFANSYALRTRAMKLSKALTSRGLLVNNWEIVTLDEVEVDVRSSQDGKQSPFAQHVTPPPTPAHDCASISDLSSPTPSPQATGKRRRSSSSIGGDEADEGQNEGQRKRVSLDPSWPLDLQGMMTWPPDEYSQQRVADDQWSDVPETDDEGTPLLRPPFVSSTALEARLTPSCRPLAASPAALQDPVDSQMADIDSDDAVALAADVTMINRLSETDDPPEVSELADAAEEDGLERGHAVELGDVTMVDDLLEHGPPVERAEDVQPEKHAGAAADSSLCDDVAHQGHPPGPSKVTQHAKDADPDKEPTPGSLVPQRDDEFYYRLIVVQAGTRLFNVPPQVFAGSSVIERVFALSQPDGAPEGSAEDRPLILPNVTEDQFSAYLRVMTAGRMYPDAPPPSVEDWMVVLGLADMWNMPKLRAEAIDAIEASFDADNSHNRSVTNDVRKSLPLHERLELADRYDVPRWRLDALVELAWREAPLDAEELRTLGPERAARLLRLHQYHFRRRVQCEEHQTSWLSSRGCQEECCGPEGNLWDDLVSETMSTFDMKMDQEDETKVRTKRDDDNVEKH